MVSISFTVVGAVSSTFLIALMAYPLSRKKYKYKNSLSFFVFFIMLFNGGIVPWYLVCTKVLHLKDNFLALVVPYLFNPWFLLLLRNFFKGIPDSIEESAKIIALFALVDFAWAAGQSGPQEESTDDQSGLEPVTLQWYVICDGQPAGPPDVMDAMKELLRPINAELDLHGVSWSEYKKGKYNECRHLQPYALYS